MSDFSYLRTHTHFSGGGGTASPTEWCRRAGQLGYLTIGMADRAPLAGLPAFVEAAESEGLVPLCGAELSLLLPPGRQRTAEREPIPAVLFARDSVGMENLSRLCALAYAGWPASETPVEWEALTGRSEGLVIVLTGEGEAGLPSPLLELAVKKLTELGGALRESFGDAAFIGLPGERALARRVASFAGQMGLPMIALPAARYPHAEDALAYRALRHARGRAGWGAHAGKQKAQESGQEYLRPPAEAAALYGEWPQAIANVARVVEMCAGVQSGRGSAEAGEAAGAILRQLAERRLPALLGVEALPDEVRDRLDAEMGVIMACGQAEAWLALGSLVEAAHANRVPLGAPLGTAGGTLLGYALSVSSLNPMPYVPWNPEYGIRDSASQINHPPPPPGVEVPSTRRDMLIAALAKEYGWERIAHAACPVDITPVAAAQAALSTLRVEGDEARLLTAQAIEKGWAAFSPTGSTGSASDGQEQSAGTLAALLNGAPVYLKPDLDTLLIAPGSRQGRARSEGRFYPPLISSTHSPESKWWVPWTEESLGSHSYPALSLRPSRPLAVLDNALSLAGKYPVPGFVAASTDPSMLPQPDDATATLITRGEVVGIPYITPKVAKGWKEGLGPEGVAALVAHSIAGHKIEKSSPSAHSSKMQNLEGPLLYSDQAATLMEIAGLTPAEAATLRLSLLKPDPDVDVDSNGELRARLVEGCMQCGLSEEEAKALWDAFVASGQGLISRHAAHAWGRVAVWSAAVKAAHPAAFLAGALAVAWQGGARANIGALTAEARRLGVSVQPLDVSRSLPGPTLEREGASWAVVWGLALLPGWSAARSERFAASRPHGEVATLRDLAVAAAEAGLSLSQLESLVRSGACDNLGGQARDRQALLDALAPMLEWAQAVRRPQGEVDLFTATSMQQPPVDEPSTLQVELPSPRERYAYRAWEEANLGAAFTPAGEIDGLRRALNGAGDLQSRLLATSQVTTEHLGKSIFVVGLLSGVKLLPPAGTDGKDETRLPDKMPLAVAQVEDLEGSIELVAFPPNYKRHRELWVDHNLVIITARVSRHIDGTLYLLCEHLVPFEGERVEEELSLKVKPEKAGGHSNDSAPEAADAVRAKDLLTQTQVVAVPRAAPGSPQAAPAGTPYTPPARSNGNGNGYNNGHSVAGGAHTDVAIAHAVGTPAYKLIISLPISEDDRTDIDTMLTLNDILAEHPGSDTVMLRIPYSLQPEAITFAHLPRGARYSSHLEAKLSKLLGAAAVAVIELQR